MTNEPLKNCPFCNGESIIVDSLLCKDMFQVICDDCGATSCSHKKETIIKLWNTRAQENKWVSVKDRLPDDNGEQNLIYVPDSIPDLLIDCYLSSRKEWDQYNWMNITHWQPLPDAPNDA